jgi:hypothetical protein
VLISPVSPFPKVMRKLSRGPSLTVRKLFYWLFISKALRSTDLTQRWRWELLFCDVTIVGYLLAISFAIVAIAYNATPAEAKNIFIG